MLNRRDPLPKERYCPDRMQIEGAVNPLLTATQLARWADEKRSQTMLPLLVRRLVLASTNPLRIDFPAGDSVNRPGYDGFLQVMEVYTFVPTGQSVWEMGVDQKPVKKAESDYATRKADPGYVVPEETTYAFVTPRRWQGKNVWASAKEAEGYWLSVRVYDADDLEQWLEECPSVAAWACRQIDRMPEGLRDIDELWEQWATRTTPHLSPGLFTAGRSVAEEGVRNWLASPPSVLKILADSADEAVGFFAAVVQRLDEPGRERAVSRALLVSTPDAWRAVVGKQTPSILLTTLPTLGSEALAVSRGHHVLIAYGNDAAGVTVDVSLPHLRRAELETALEEMGLPFERRHRLAAESRGRISALVELLGGGVAPPHWASPSVAGELLPLLLAGSWCQSEGDLDAICRLSRLAPEELPRRLARWVNETDPPIRSVGGAWEWVSRQRAWPHLGRFVTAEDLRTFFQVVAEVLGEDDPRLTLPPERRSLAPLFDCTPRYSEILRKGLAEGLALLAGHPEPGKLVTDPATLVGRTVRNLFGPSPCPQRWYSLASILPFLGEAAPEVFLEMVERDAIGDPAVRAVLFQEEGYFGGSRHCHLLWALEIIAWSPDHFPLASLLLAELHANDLGSKTGNSPHESLRAIFLPWCPHTSATVSQRIASIDLIHRRLPAVAFELCVRLLPHGYDTVTPTPRPRWRSWAEERNAGAGADRFSYIESLFQRALAWAEEDPRRWARLLNPIPGVSHELLGQLFAKLVALPLEQLAEGPGDFLRRAVRKVLHQKRSIEAVYPEITGDLLDRLVTAYDRLEPSDRVGAVAWLFDRHPDLLNICGSDWRAEEEIRDRERQEAVNRLIRDDVCDDVLRLAEVAEDAWAVGVYLGQSGLSDTAISAAITDRLVSNVQNLQKFALGAVWGRFRRDGWPWVERIFTPELCQWSPARKATFASALLFESRTWDWVEAWGEEVASLYWRTKSGWVSDPHRDAPRAIRTLLAHRRPFTALHVVQLTISGDRNWDAVGADLLLAVLRALTQAACGQTEANEKLVLEAGFSYELGQLIQAVERAGVADKQELTYVEWVWFPALEHTERGPATIHRALTQEPSFFAQVVGLADFSTRDAGQANQSAELAELAKERIWRARRLLEEWHGVPGRKEDGSIDTDALWCWARSARLALSQSGHSEFGDQEVGRVLARAPASSDGIWPHEAVRRFLEEVRSEELENGIYYGTINGRGVTCRSSDDGGELEMRLVEKYERWAKAVVASAPRAARVLRMLADNYRAQARMEDARRDLNEFR